jgi:hypothetical protein
VRIDHHNKRKKRTKKKRKKAGLTGVEVLVVVAACFRFHLSGKMFVPMVDVVFAIVVDLVRKGK